MCEETGEMRVMWKLTWNNTDDFLNDRINLFPQLINLLILIKYI